MVEQSWFWSSTSPGDASEAPYSDDEYSDIQRKIWQRNRTSQGYIEDYLNELAVSNPSGNDIRVASGAALVDGKFYENDANEDNTIATPSVSTRIDRVVLRKSWAAQTIRIAILTGVEGGGVPALTQTDGVTWEISLAQVSITTAPAITLTDERVIARTPLAEDTGGLTSGFTEIQTINGDGVITSFDFSGIPASFAHLFVIGNIRSATAVIVEDLLLTFNADGGANYHEHVIEAVNVTVSAAVAANQVNIEIARIVGASGLAGYSGGFSLHIPNYADTNLQKIALCQWSAIPNTTVANWESGQRSGQWLDASAINQITLATNGGGAIETGSKATLYGLG